MKKQEAGNTALMKLIWALVGYFAYKLGIVDLPVSF
jgi:hypothetical protein